mgnify:CR=1 FL=1
MMVVAERDSVAECDEVKSLEFVVYSGIRRLSAVVREST